MKKRFSLLSIALTLFYCSLAKAEEIPIKDQLVKVNQTIKYGIWRLYNDGTHIYFIDPDANHIADTGLGTSPIFYTEKNDIRIFSDGVASLDERVLLNTEEAVNITLTAPLNGELKDGRYRFNDKQYVVSNGTIRIFEFGSEGLRGEVEYVTVLKKYANGMVYTGTHASAIISPTTILDANGNPKPALEPGDCLATYSSETGRVEIPCLTIKGEETVYRVGEQQIHDTLTFEVNENDISPVQ